MNAIRFLIAKILPPLAQQRQDQGVGLPSTGRMPTLRDVKGWLVLAVIALVLLAVLGRYAVIPVPVHGTDAHAVLLDRWTGQTTPAATPVPSPAFTY